MACNIRYSSPDIGLFFKETQTVTVTAADDSYQVDGYDEDNPDHQVRIGYYLYQDDGTGKPPVTVEELENVSFRPYSAPFSLDPASRYVVYAKLTDHATEVKVTVRETHDFIWITDQEATETEAGLKHEECTICGYAEAPVEIPATGPEEPEKPAEPEKPTEPDKKDATDKPAGPATDDADEDVVAQTGDPTDIAPWIMLMLASGAAVTGSWIWRRKRR